MGYVEITDPVGDEPSVSGRAHCQEPGCRWVSPEEAHIATCLMDLQDHHYAEHDDTEARRLRIEAAEAAPLSLQI